MTTRHLSILPSPNPRCWPRAQGAWTASAFPSALVTAVLLLGATGCHRAPDVVVPVPQDPAGLEAQLRAYIEDKVAWVRQRPRDPAREATLGLVYAANGLWPEARLAFENVVLLKPAEPLGHLYAAVATQEMGNLESARTQYRQTTERFADFPQAYYRLGEISLRLGDVDAAEAAFRRLIQLAPKEWRGYAGLGEVLLRRGQLAAAATELEQAVRLDPAAGSAHHLLGLVYRGLGRTEDAEIQLGLGTDQLSYPMGDPWSEQAGQHMRRIQDLTEMATDLCRNQRFDVAAGLLRNALRYTPTNLALLNNLAITLNQGGQPDAAEPILRKVLELDPGNVPARVTLSFVKASQGRLDEALDWATQAATNAPALAQPHLARANALLALERDADALAAIEDAARAEPRNADIQLELAAVLARNLNQPAAALDHLRKAVELNPASPTAQGRLADLALAQGDTNTARRAVALLRKLRPGHPGVRALEARLGEAGLATNTPGGTLAPAPIGPGR